MAIETIANLTGQFNQFDKRVERMQIESDNTKRELTEAINGLREDNKFLLAHIDAVNNNLVARMDTGFQDLRGELKQEIQSAKQDFGTWQISCLIATVIAACAVAGLLFQ